MNFICPSCGLDARPRGHATVKDCLEAFRHAAYIVDNLLGRVQTFICHASEMIGHHRPPNPAQVGGTYVHTHRFGLFADVENIQHIVGAATYVDGPTIPEMSPESQYRKAVGHVPIPVPAAPRLAKIEMEEAPRDRRRSRAPLRRPQPSTSAMPDGEGVS